MWAARRSCWRPEPPMDAGTSCSPARAPPMAFRHGCPSRRAIAKSGQSYGQTKLVAERMLKEAEAAHGIRHVAAALFQCRGRRSRRRIGELPPAGNASHPWFCSLPWAALPAAKIFGNDYPTQDGTCIRDFVHVSDLADAHLLPSTGWQQANQAIRSISAMAAASQLPRFLSGPASR